MIRHLFPKFLHCGLVQLRLLFSNVLFQLAGLQRFSYWVCRNESRIFNGFPSLSKYLRHFPGTNRKSDLTFQVEMTSEMSWVQRSGCELEPFFLILHSFKGQTPTSGNLCDLSPCGYIARGSECWDSNITNCCAFWTHWKSKYKKRVQSPRRCRHQIGQDTIRVSGN